MRKESAGADKDEAQAAKYGAEAQQIANENAMGAVMQRLGLVGMPMGA